MLNISIPCPIRDLDGNELLAAGALLDEKSIAEIASRGRKQKFDSVCLLRQDRIRDELHEFMGMEQYGTIFGGVDGVRAHISRIGEVPIPKPLLSAIERFRSYDFYTYRHSLIVFALTTFMMEVVGQPGNRDKSVNLVGPTHDLGKLSVPARVLLKRTPLTRQERSLLESHTVAGYVLASYYLGDQRHPAALVALNHHERRNGTGYPRGLTELDPIAEMVATCDIYDALITSRPYREGVFDNRTALESLMSLVEEGELNRHCVKALIGRNRSDHPAPEHVKVSSEKRGVPPSNNCYGLIIEE